MTKKKKKNFMTFWFLVIVVSSLNIALVDSIESLSETTRIWEIFSSSSQRNNNKNKNIANPSLHIIEKKFYIFNCVFFNNNNKKWRGVECMCICIHMKTMIEEKDYKISAFKNPFSLISSSSLIFLFHLGAKITLCQMSLTEYLYFHKGLFSFLYYNWANTNCSFMKSHTLFSYIWFGQNEEEEKSNNKKLTTLATLSKCLFWIKYI